MQEVTFSMIKPDATARALMGRILSRLEEEQFVLKAGRLEALNPSLARVFYQEHRDKPFFSSLVEFVCSGPVFLMALMRPGAVLHLRRVIGDTDPQKAQKNTLRALYGESIEKNSIHGSASVESAQRELALFFKKEEYLIR